MIYFLCQAAAPDLSAIQSWLQLATSTGFVGLTWYLIGVALPAMQKRFDDHSDGQMAAFTAEIKRQSEHNSVQIQTIIELAKGKNA